LVTVPEAGAACGCVALCTSVVGVLMRVPSLDQLEFWRPGSLTPDGATFLRQFIAVPGGTLNCDHIPAMGRRGARGHGWGRPSLG
jgi:hypothetical protein